MLGHALLMALLIAQPQQTDRERSAYYKNCDAARAAGVAPIRRGQPGYRPALDRDNDGIACEPYRGKRNRPKPDPFPGDRRPPPD